MKLNLVLNQESIFPRDHFVQTVKNYLLEKFQKPGKFVIESHKENPLTTLLFCELFYIFFPLPLHCFPIYTLFLCPFHFKWMFSAWFPSELFSMTSMTSNSTGKSKPNAIWAVSHMSKWLCIQYQGSHIIAWESQMIVFVQIIMITELG